MLFRKNLGTMADNNVFFPHWKAFVFLYMVMQREK